MSTSRCCVPLPSASCSTPTPGATGLAREVAQAWREWQERRRRREESESNAQALAAEREQLQWQVQELSRLAFSAQEWDTLQADHRRLSHAASLQEAVEYALESLSEGEAAALAVVGAVVSRLSAAAEYDPEAQGEPRGPRAGADPDPGGGVRPAPLPRRHRPRPPPPAGGRAAARGSAHARRASTASVPSGSPRRWPSSRSASRRWVMGRARRSSSAGSSRPRRPTGRSRSGCRKSARGPPRSSAGA